MRFFFQANKDKMKIKAVYQDSLVFVDEKIRIPVCDLAFEVITVGSLAFKMKLSE
jgi:hypothetical protein